MRSSLLLALIVGLALAGCGKDKAASGSASAPPAASEPTAAAPATAALPTAAALPTKGARRVPIEVRKTGYVPNTLAADAKEEIVLVFKRVEDTACGRFIKVIGTDLEAELPMNQPVEIPVTMPDSGEIVFACGMDMMHGVVTVNPTPG